MSATRDEEGVFSRWARLKREEAERLRGAKAGEPPEVAVEAGAVEPEPAAPNDGAASDASASLPDIESLNADSDFAAFLKAGVPDHLHKMALRKLWRSDPVLANVDGLNDYDLDYTIKEAMEVAVQSAEDLARGSKRLNVSDLRAKDREDRARARHGAAADDGEEARRGGVSSSSVASGEGVAAGEASGEADAGEV